MRHTQFEAKLKELGYHLVDSEFFTRVYEHGNYVCELLYLNEKYQTNMHTGFIPSDINYILSQYSEY